MNGRFNCRSLRNWSEPAIARSMTGYADAGAEASPVFFLHENWVSRYVPSVISLSATWPPLRIRISQGSSPAPSHDVSSVSAGSGERKWGPASTGGCDNRTPIGRRYPSLHTGQRSELVCEGLVAGKSTQTFCECASSSVRHNWILSARPRLARNPKWRIFTNPRGSTWSRKRRMNSAAGRVIMPDWALLEVNELFPSQIGTSCEALSLVVRRRLS
jgi:hypothetical protein